MTGAALALFLVATGLLTWLAVRLADARARRSRPSLDDVLAAHTRAERDRRLLDWSAPGVGLFGHPAWCHCSRCAAARVIIAAHQPARRR